MLSAIRSRITYVNVVATLVLVFAMTGGALAAKKYLITSTKQISPSVLKSLQGKNGAAGTAGAAGVAGAQGAAGPAGPVGPAGAKGDTGAAGKEGLQGKEGATGKEGKAGKEGKPWTAGGTLPPDATETGEWGTGPNTPESASNGRWSFDISFSIPLAQAPEVVFVPANKEKEPGCGGRGGGTFPPPSGAYVPGIPQASPGKLCIYIDAVENAQVLEVRTPVYTEEGHWEEFVGASPTGGLIQVQCAKGEECVAEGSWAVTGAEE